MKHSYRIHTEILISEKQIRDTIYNIAKQISKDYKNKNLLFLSILNGSFLFAADLIREVSRFGLNPEIEFLKVKSYNGTKSTGSITYLSPLPDVSNKDILIVEDIFDTGLTLKTIYEQFSQLSPLSLNIAVLIVKKKLHEFQLPVKYYGFEIDNRFVVGYGLDYNNKFRGLPYIGIYNG